jgi:hypothetical protein
MNTPKVWSHSFVPLVFTCLLRSRWERVIPRPSSHQHRVPDRSGLALIQGVRWRTPETVQRKSWSTLCGRMFAWASIALPDCMRIWFFVKSTICSAMSVSLIRDSEACMFS